MNTIKKFMLIALFFLPFAKADNFYQDVYDWRNGNQVFVFPGENHDFIYQFQTEPVIVELTKEAELIPYEVDNDYFPNERDAWNVYFANDNFPQELYPVAFTNGGGGGCHNETAAFNDFQENYAQKEKVLLTPHWKLNNGHFPNVWNAYFSDDNFPQDIYLVAAFTNGGGGGPKKQMKAEEFQHDYHVDNLADMAINHFAEVSHNNYISRQVTNGFNAIFQENWDMGYKMPADNFTNEGVRVVNYFPQELFNDFQFNAGNEIIFDEQTYLAIQKFSGMKKIPNFWDINCTAQDPRNTLTLN